jgi:hypothetical protein
MSSFNALPREGHLEALYHMFAYLAKADRHSIVFDASSPDLKPSLMVTTDWTDFYGDVSEAIPPKMPKPRGNPVNTTCLVDANHAGDLVTRRSQTGILIFVMKSPIVWYSKRQNTVETSTFGSELVAMRQATEFIEALRTNCGCLGFQSMVLRGFTVTTVPSSVIHQSGRQLRPRSTMQFATIA